MRKIERLARENMRSNGFSDFQYRPNKNAFPTFVVDGKIGVVVLGLNPDFDNSGTIGSFEIWNYRLMNMLTDIIEELKPEYHQHSAYVGINLEGPISLDDDTKLHTRLALRRHLETLNLRHRYPINDSLILETVPAGERFDVPYRAGIYYHWNHHGGVEDILVSFFENRLQNIEARTANFKDQFESIWLIFGDRVGYVSDAEGIAKVRSAIPEETIFDRILIVSPLDNLNGVVLK